MLTTQDFVEPGERDMLCKFAPAEENCEEFAFPGIFCLSSRPTTNERKKESILCRHYVDIV